MNHRRVAATKPAPRLPVVVEEIAEKLLQDDWYRVLVDGGECAYYVLGAKAQTADENVAAQSSQIEFPMHSDYGPIAEWAVRSQLADNIPSKYLKKARQELEDAGVPAAVIDRFLRGDMDALWEFNFDRSLSIIQRARAGSHFFQAVRLVKEEIIDLSPDEESEVESAREKICLAEISRKYSKIVGKWEQLTQLSFDDAQLEEASRTFLYGFYRATVVLCASAVETRLRHLTTPAAERAAAFELIEIAEKRKLIDRDLARYARDLFSFRNRVAHDDHEPSHLEAKDILGTARLLIASFLGAVS